MEYSFYKGKNSIIKKDTFEMFQSSVTGLTQKSYLSLLLKYAIEYTPSSFDKYFEFLLKQGADINYTQPKSIENISLENVNLLMNACQMTDLKTVEMFLSYKDIQIFKKDKSRKNIVHYAIQNENEQNSRNITYYLFQQYPQLVFMHLIKKLLGNFGNGNYNTLSIENYKPNLLKYLLENQIQIDYIRNQNRIFHKVIQVHKNQQITLLFIRILTAYGCKQEILDEEQNYIEYAIKKGILSIQQGCQISKQLKGQSQIKQSTLQTSPQQKLFDSHEQDFQDQGYFDYQQSSENSQQQLQYQLNHVLVSQQMLEMALKIQQARNNTWATLHPFYLKLYNLVAQLYGSIQVIGSFASNLWIPNCDIDFLLIIPQNNLDLFDQIVEVLYSKIKKLQFFKYSQLYFGYKLPMIKLTLGSQYNNLQVQLFLSNKKNISSRYVTFIQQVVAYYPEIQIIYFVVRKILQAKLLHDHKHGGLKAYALFLLIYSMRSQYNYQHISQFLQHFTYYYGLAYEYTTQIVQDEVVFKINIVDPLNNENNMGGKKTDILGLQQVFKKVYYGLNMPNIGNKLDFIISLIKDT